MYRVVRNTYHPVVRHYMDIIYSAANRTKTNAENVEYKRRHDKLDRIVCDSPIIAWHYLMRGYKNLAVWFQGVLPEESFLSRRSHLRFFLLGVIEKVVLKRAKCVFLVSEEMRIHYQNKYHVDLSEKAFIMPCFNETHVYPEAFTESIKGQTIEFLYVGSLSKWQCFSETVDLFSRIEKRSDKPLLFSIYTQEQEEAKRILDEYGVRNYRIDYVNHDDLANRIKSCRYGFVIREDTVINRVATPTKFSNYLSNGIVPVYAECLSSFHKMAMMHGIGIACQIDDLDDAAERVLRHLEKNTDVCECANQCKKVFDTYYNTERYVKQISEFLEKITWRKR